MAQNSDPVAATFPRRRLPDESARIARIARIAPIASHADRDETHDPRGYTHDPSCPARTIL
jgi:hypothetical protein